MSSSAIAGTGAVAATFLTECRPSGRTNCIFPSGGVPNNVGPYTVEMRDIAGNLVGCKELLQGAAAATSCSVGGGTAVNDGFPYNFNFPMVGNAGNGAPVLVQCRKTPSVWPANCGVYTSTAGTTAFTIPLLQGTVINAPAADTGTRGVLAGCMADNTRCPTAADMNIFACTYAQGLAAGVGTRVCGAPAATAASANTGFPIPLLSADGTRIQQCRWNGLGGADVTTLGGADTAPGNTPDIISVMCTAGSSHSVTIAKSTYTSVAAGLNAGLPQEGTGAAGALVALDGQNARACMAAGANAAACYSLTATGFPFSDGPAQRFIQSIENSGFSAGTLLACANLDAATGCNSVAGSRYRVFTRSAAGARPEGSFMSGCTGVTANAADGGATLTDQGSCQNWVDRNYARFDPRVQCSLT
jgi:hypothetical protein